MAPAVMQRLLEICLDPKSQGVAAVAAAREIMNRAYGQPEQAQVNVNVDGGGNFADGDHAKFSALLQRARLSQIKPKSDDELN